MVSLIRIEESREIGLANLDDDVPGKFPRA